MRVRENRATVWQSMHTTVHVKDRAQLVRYISGKLQKNGYVISDDIIHVTHYGYDDRIDWNEYIIVVEGFGVFGYTDEPCPGPLENSASRDLPEMEIAFTPPPARRRVDLPNSRSARAVKNATPEPSQRQLAQGQAYETSRRNATRRAT